jgi:histone acetyltransferase MYST1
VAASQGEALEIGARAACLRVGQPHPCEIIERRPAVSTSGDTEEWGYYVHYLGLNRRLDEWVTADRIVRDQSGSGNARDGGELGSRRATRKMKRRIDDMNALQAGASHDEELEKEHEESTKIKNIQTIEMGRFEVDTWYFSPFPDNFAQQRKLYICEFTLKYMKKRKTYLQHCERERARQPPGKLIYRMPAPELHRDCLAAGLEQPKELSIFEVNGSEAKVYCQCLCLLAKLFLDHKTLYYDVDPFLFYVLCEVGADGGHRIAGYFSKEKASVENNNIACILVLPQHQRKGYSKLLIDTAYQLSMREGKVGSPEKPLSDLGLLSFRSYWTQVLLQTLSTHRGNVSVAEISVMTSITTDDIISTLQSLNLIKYWKGQHVISVSAKIVDEHLKANSRASLR